MLKVADGYSLYDSFSNIIDVEQGPVVRSPVNVNGPLSIKTIIGLRQAAQTLLNILV